MDGTRTLAGTTATPTHKPLDDRTRQRLQRATREFESLLVGYMIKSMRAGTNTSELFGDSYGGDVLDGMFDGQMAQFVSRNSSFGLAESLYRRMTGEEMPRKAAPAPAHAVTAAAVQPVVHPQQNNTAMKTGNLAAERVVSPSETESTSARTVRGVPPVAAAGRESLQVGAPDPVLSRPAAISAAQDTAMAVPDTVARRLDRVAPLIQEASATHGVDTNLLKAIVATESGRDIHARSPKNAKGLMQLIDSTATAMGVKDVWNPRENLLGGAKYLSQLIEHFGGDQEKAVASYNAGPGAVQKHGGIPPFKETRAYVEKVMNYMKLFAQEESGNGNED